MSTISTEQLRKQQVSQRLHTLANASPSEAKALLLHTDWNVADIAYSLGFEYPTYFNNFFKKLTGTNPMSLRGAEV